MKKWKCEKTVERLTKVWKLMVKLEDAGYQDKADVLRALYFRELGEYRELRDRMQNAYGNIA